MAKQNKLDQLSDQKRRMKMLQLRRDVEDMMNDRRQKYAENMQLQKRLEEEEEKELEERYNVLFSSNSVIFRIFASMRPNM